MSEDFLGKKKNYQKTVIVNYSELLKKAIPYILIVIIWQLISIYVKNKAMFASIVFPGIDQMILKDLPELTTLWGGIDHSLSGSREASIMGGLKVIGFHSIHTLKRVFGGTLGGLAIGSVMGIIIGYNRSIAQMFTLTLELLRMIPLLALALLFIIWFGGSEIGVFIYGTYGVFVTILIYTFNAVRNIPPIYMQYAKTLGANRIQVISKVIIPGILPELAAGLKVSIGFAWAINLAGEYLAVENGLGRMILISESFMQTGKMLILVFVIVVYAIFGDYLIGKACSYITRWVPRRT